MPGVFIVLSCCMFVSDMFRLKVVLVQTHFGSSTRVCSDVCWLKHLSAQACLGSSPSEVVGRAVVTRVSEPPRGRRWETGLMFKSVCEC